MSLHTVDIPHLTPTHQETFQRTQTYQERVDAKEAINDRIMLVAQCIAGIGIILMFTGVAVLDSTVLIVGVSCMLLATTVLIGSIALEGCFSNY